MRRFLHTLILTLIGSAAFAEPALPFAPVADYDLMVEAARRTHEAQRVLYRYRAQLGLDLPQFDLNCTGLVGADTSIMTTTPGVLEAKRGATNPDFSAMLVRIFRAHGVESNDSVLVTMTGSLPGFNLALAVVLDLLELPALRIFSFGSSSYGANLPDFTWLDMEDILVREGLLKNRSRWVTLGGTHDLMEKRAPETREMLRQKCARLGYALMETSSVDEQRDLRLKIFGEPNHYALLINIGGNHLMLGGRDENSHIPGGWIRAEGGDWNAYRTVEPAGIMFDFLDAGVPVLNLLQVEELSRLYGVPYDPVPLKPIGTTPVYFQRAQQ